jgi:hypothetical protein
MIRCPRKTGENRLDHADVLPNFRPLIQDPARVAELADALDSGSSAFTGVKVRVLSRAPCTARVWSEFPAGYASGFFVGVHAGKHLGKQDRSLFISIFFAPPELLPGLIMPHQPRGFP